ncbi:MAG: hypothetical protein FWG05_02940, partial [Kiritimatiellaeota bacterium]|nr:hypothetical protein [Kiritimatiellota bacterium]
KTKGGIALFVAVGNSPEELIENSAAWIARAKNPSEERLFPATRLRKSKPFPDFAEKIGWCTWNAFYRDVSAEKVRAGLARFKSAEIAPKFVILDDGWQQTELTPTGGEWLTGFGANEKFPGGLKPLVDAAKNEYGAERFLVWHAVSGYWRGMSRAAFPEYRPMPVQQMPGRYNMMQPCMDWMPGMVSYLPAKNMRKFFTDYHEALAAEGVDGVKIDNQASFAYLAAGSGGRARLFKTVRDALDFSVEKHFGNRLISCMAHSQEIWYNARNNNLARGSDDFFPDVDASHGMHLWTNAMTAAWFGEFMWIDWDMFESAHKFGAYHAAARAVSGGPVYTADKPGRADAALLRKLVCSDGSVLRADAPAKPAPDCLFTDPVAENSALKICAPVGDAVVIGLFDLDTAAPGGDVSATLSPAVFPRLKLQRYAIYLHERRAVSVVNREDSIRVNLGARKYEVATIAPVKFVNTFAPIGLIDKFNSHAAILSVEKSPDDSLVMLVKLRDGGVFGAWTKTAPTRVKINSAPAEFSWSDGLLEIPVSTQGETAVEIKLASA